MILVDRFFALRALTALALAALVASAGPPSQAQAPPGAEGRIEFGGTWSASGHRQALAAGPDRTASIVHLRGTLLLTSAGKLGRGFGTESVGFDDGRGTSVGAGVWTDERGDQVFSDVRGGPIETGRSFSGVITGGTGRYAGLTGEWTLDWQYVIRTEDGNFQVRAVKFKGRARFGPPAAGETPK
jgi:hypothetical protein